MKEMSSATQCNLFGYPPKPPCWQDFCQSQPSSGKKGILYQSNPSAKALHNANTTTCGEAKRKSSKKAGAGTAGSKQKSKLWRTWSEPNICDTDFPVVYEEERTLNLSDVVLPRDNSQMIDVHLYMRENYKRCQKWLASVEPSFPPDESDICAPSDSDCDGTKGHEKTAAKNDENKKESKKAAKKLLKGKGNGTDNGGKETGSKEKWRWSKGRRLWKWNANSSSSS